MPVVVLSGCLSTTEITTPTYGRGWFWHMNEKKKKKKHREEQGNSWEVSDPWLEGKVNGYGIFWQGTLSDHQCRQKDEDGYVVFTEGFTGRVSRYSGRGPCPLVCRSPTKESDSWHTWSGPVFGHERLLWPCSLGWRTSRTLCRVS